MSCISSYCPSKPIRIGGGGGAPCPCGGYPYAGAPLATGNPGGGGG